MAATEEDFVRKWKKHVACLAFFGVVSEAKDGLLQRASRMMEIPDEVEKLLKAMYKDLVVTTQAVTQGLRRAATDPPPVTASNGGGQR
jgi:hypothetical protein